MRPAKHLLPLLLCAWATGCASDVIDPVYEIPADERVVVLPYKDPDMRNRWDAPNGHRLAEATTKYLSRDAEFLVCDYQKVLDLLLSQEDVRQLTPRDVADLLKARYVLLCDVSFWQLRDPLSLNLSQGSTKVAVHLFKAEELSDLEEQEVWERMRDRQRARDEAGLKPIVVERGGKVVQSNDVQARFPDDFMMGPAGEAFMHPDEVERGLIEMTALKVARLYVPHTRDRHLDE